METSLPFPPDVKTAFDEFRSWGAVVDHFLFSAPDVVDEYAHEGAAKAGLLSVIETQKLKVTCDLSKLEAARAEQQTLQEFFGEHFDVATCKSLFHFPNTLFLHYFDDEENAHLRRSSIVKKENLLGHGYAHAIIEPPYGLYELYRHSQGKKKDSFLALKIGANFLELCDALFGDLTDLQIYSWPTECSSYFEPGYEWWGSDFWTVYSPSKNWIVVILSSATD